MIPAVVDISGLNRFSTSVFRRAASTIVALVESNHRTNPEPSSADVADVKPL